MEGQRLEAVHIFAKEQHASLDSHGFYHYTYMDTFGTIDKEEAREKKGAETRESGKRLYGEGGRGTAENKEQTPLNIYEKNRERVRVRAPPVGLPLLKQKRRYEHSRRCNEG